MFIEENKSFNDSLPYDASILVMDIKYVAMNFVRTFVNGV